MRTQTTNGENALITTGSSLVNFFFNVGAARNNVEGIRRTFATALEVDPVKATAILLWSRDIRHGGAGERKVFRQLVRDLTDYDMELAEKVIRLIPEIGRFDDFLSLYDTNCEHIALRVWADHLINGNVLAFKWADRKNVKLRQFMNFKNEAEFRKFISAGRSGKILEQLMCSGRWQEIQYGKLPSIAGARYAKAFGRKDAVRYSEFMTSKETKVNASVAFPHDVYRMIKNIQYDTNKETQIAAATKYWENLAQLDVNGNILVMADVSGSMGCICSGCITCMDVSVSLGAFIAEQCKGHFNGKLMTFSARPTIVTLPKDANLQSKFSFVENMAWGMNTDIAAGFRAILKEATNAKVSQDQMPKYLLILSDMQFDQAVTNPNDKNTMLEKMRAEYESNGYELPQVIFWNLNASYGNFPSISKENGVAMVSGFSPAILKAVLAAEDLRPDLVLNEAIAPFIEMLQGV